MIDPKNISFSITGEEIAKLQQAELGRELRPAEHELFDTLAEIANQAYTAATKSDADTLWGLLSAINNTPAADEYSRHVAALCRGWVLLGWHQGSTQHH